MPDASLKILDLFSGIGGFSIACERAGMTVIRHIEIDSHAQKVLKYRWPDVPLWGDITTYTGGGDANEKPDPRPDVIVGGFP